MRNLLSSLLAFLDKFFDETSAMLEKTSGRRARMEQLAAWQQEWYRVRGIVSMSSLLSAVHTHHASGRNCVQKEKELIHDCTRKNGHHPLR